MNRLILFLVAALLSNAAEPRRLIVAIGPDVPLGDRLEVGNRLAQLLYEGDAGVRVTVLDAARVRVVADVIREDSVVRLRQQRHAREVAAVFNFVKTNLGASVNLPVLLDEIGRQLKPGKCSVLLVGNSRYHNPLEPTLDLRKGWPSDGHLSAGRDRSVFSTVERSHQLDGIAIHWFVTDSTEVMNESHRYGLERFWSLYVGTQGGVLASYSASFKSALSSTLEDRRTACLNVAINVRDTDVALNSRTMAVSAREVSLAPTTNVPVLTNFVRNSAEPMLPPIAPEDTGIAIVWTGGAVDLDLYVVVPRDGKELYYLNTRSPNGRYYRDIRQSLPGNDGNWKSAWEFVELNGDQLPAEVWINFFSGTGPLQGELRILHQGVERSIPFHFPAVNGNHGAEGKNRQNDPHWIKIQTTTRLTP